MANRPVQARSELSTLALLDAAAEVIAEVGYERATLAAIGERAGYSHGLVTRRFESKAKLLSALIERMTFVWGDAQLRGRAGDHRGTAGVIVVIDAVRGFHRRSPREFRALYSLMFEALKPIPVLRDRMAELHREFRASIELGVREGIEAGLVPASVDPAAVARVLISGLRGAAYQWLLDPGEFDMDRALLDLRSLMEDMLGGRPA
ncbi:TetR family transcriptional regulator [Microtetraspora sp. NBRC 13810]|nr:TetR family transcriptional regulator [Microtetraspora sp. NBRC 13810]